VVCGEITDDEVLGFACREASSEVKGFRGRSGALEEGHGRWDGIEVGRAVRRRLLCGLLEAVADGLTDDGDKGRLRRRKNTATQRKEEERSGPQTTLRSHRTCSVQRLYSVLLRAVYYRSIIFAHLPGPARPSDSTACLHQCHALARPRTFM
jgi:hypothetical protein